jgi:hypothetical protein
MTVRACALFLALFAATGCRTQIVATKRPPPKVVYVGEKQCNVYDFAGATDVPDGSHNLGWVEVPQQATDEETYVKLREKICELGGDGLSQPAWVREQDEELPRLKANAWSLP